MLLPVLVWYIVFAYAPIYGITLAFKQYTFRGGILGSPWIGLENFRQIFNDSSFIAAFRNNIVISLGKLAFHFPTPIILAIMLFEITLPKAKKIYQTVFTFPHFISWVVLSGILINFLGQDGLINKIIVLLGGDSVSFLTSTLYFRPVLYLSHIWKEIGWDSIIYIAALAGINPELYEAADMDGAGRWQRIRNITWPGLRPTVAILLILTVGQMLNFGNTFDQVFNLYSAPVYSVGEIIDTYVYRSAFVMGANFGYVTAVGFFKSVINLVMIFLANTLVKKFGEESLF
jgi:putative aldouronate transport system permease protein